MLYYTFDVINNILDIDTARQAKVLPGFYIAKEYELYENFWLCPCIDHGANIGQTA